MNIWEEIGLHGRNKLIQDRLIPAIVHESRRFVLTGEPGAGKSALLQWAARQSKRKCVVVSANTQTSVMLKEIAGGLGLEVSSSGRAPHAREYETAILQTFGHVIFVDDIHKAMPAKLEILKAFANRHKIGCAMRSGIAKRDELRQFLWGFQQIEVKRIGNADCEKIAKALVLKRASRLDPIQIARASNGLVGRMVAMINSDRIERDTGTRLRSEEIDIGPYLIGAFAFMAIFRMFGRGMDSTDLAMLGTVIMIGVRVIVRPFVSAGRQK